MFGRLFSWTRQGKLSEKSLQTLAIVGALVLLGGVAYLAARAPSSDSRHPGEQLKCRECGHEWTMSSRETGEERAGANNPAKLMKCPKCGKDAGQGMSPCEKCGKWYLPKVDGQPGAYRCPHCGFDPIPAAPADPPPVGQEKPSTAGDE